MAVSRYAPEAAGLRWRSQPVSSHVAYPLARGVLDQLAHAKRRTARTATDWRSCKLANVPGTLDRAVYLGPVCVKGALSEQFPEYAACHGDTGEKLPLLVGGGILEREAEKYQGQLVFG